ncbi:phosphoribosylglycinamide formyltransferase [Alkalibaculum bacchi]|uniref:phosphoribosylglycinamide formyltransferase n=1 Tax=Alkalibaculum bacchi TaxID=645887 RepID=UPI0026EE2216|nr:phosphoribosylglycinamide formyltransferase [Alkalibaculum bacchi]
MALKKIAVFVSGGGSNLQTLIDQVHGKNGNIELVLSNNLKAYGLKRAEEHNIAAYHINSNEEDKIIKLLRDKKIDFIVLAGYLKKISSKLVHSYKGKIINIHPSLIPSFCGPSYYGIKVHEKAIEYGVKVSGATVHFVDEGMDTGPIIMQETVAVYPNDSMEDLQKRVLEVEHRILSESVKKMCQDKLILNGRIVTVLE